MASDTALLVIDVQTGFIDGDPPVYKAAEMLEKIRNLIDQAESAAIPVIYMHHNEGPEGEWPIHPDIAPRQSGIVLDKMTPDSFHETELQEHLNRLGVRNLVICGFQTEYCINTTTRRAADLGYGVTLLKDVHSTFSDEDSTSDAAALIAKYSNTLAEVAHVIDSTDFSFK